MESHAEPAYAACLRFFAELRSLGVTDAVVSPGSRSTVLALSAHAAGMDITVHHDERVGAFHALGAARQSRRPVVLVCSSGTAGANYHPAVIEAHHAGVPMIVCTADRPPELRTWGAGQTVDQVHLFGTSVRWFHETPVADSIDEPHARALALRAYERAAVGAGPVHLNWPFREPLHPGGPLQAPEPTLAPHVPMRSQPSERLRSLADRFERGLIVVGPSDLAADVAAEVTAFAGASGWPVLADPASGLRSGSHHEHATVVTTAELFLAVDAVTPTLSAPDVVVRIGLSPTSKAYRLWLESNRPRHLVLVDPAADWSDPTGSVTEVVSGPLPGLFAPARAAEKRTPWTARWAEVEHRAAAAAAGCVAADRSELGFVHRLIEAMAAANRPMNLVVSNSMPIRDVDFVMRPTGSPIRVIANRGANGIDGVLATGLGVASASADHTVVLLGDVATVHDLGGLAAIPRLGATSMTVVVVDNDNGGIFSILPVRRAIPDELFDQLFGTPHGTDLAAVGAAMNFVVTELDADADVEMVFEPQDGPRLVVARTTVAGMTDGVAELRTAVANAFS